MKRKQVKLTAQDENQLLDEAIPFVVTVLNGGVYMTRSAMMPW
jgi:hypothetical protein